ncbi:MAG TPA: MFS transporter [Fimbriimonas sp.]|nr:MFS transporter [Fimbriimonas sp.]
MTTELSPAEEATLRRDWLLFAVLTFLFNFGFAVYSGPFQNFLRDVLHAHELDLGRLESLREIPGLLTAITAGTLVAFAETRIAALGLLVAGIGIGVTGVFRDFPPLIGITVFWSIGFHLYATMSTAITLTLAKGKEGGRHLGRMSGVGAVAGIAGLGVVYLLDLILSKNYTVFFAVGGVAIAAGAVACTMLSSHAHGGKRQRIVLRKEYGLFYLLTFLEGCRRQIFSIFASFALILVYKVPVGEMLLIQFVNAILIWITAPRIGELVDELGERGPLSFYAIGLIVVFFGYATMQTTGALIGLFLIDNILFSFGIGFNTYLHRIVRPGELTPCLSMGTTMNHIAAVTVPYFGALLWKESGNYQLPFWVGTGIACVSLIATRWLPAGVALEQRGREADESDGVSNVVEGPHASGEIV